MHVHELSLSQHVSDDSGEVTLHTHQMLAKMISEFADELHKTEERICFSMHSSLCVCVSRKLIIDWCIYLIHALHIFDPRI